MKTVYLNTDEQNNENNENENAIEPTLDNGDGEIFDDSISLINIDDEMKSSLEYTISVIVGSTTDAETA